MLAILGKIIDRVVEDSGSDGTRIAITFKTNVVMPDRTKPPEWLTDQKLTVTREVADPREIGELGEGIILSADESDKFLAPLRVEPELAHTSVPRTMQCRLLWWKDANPPDLTATTRGRTVTCKWVRTGESYTAEVETADLVNSVEPTLPLTIDFACDKLRVSATILPEKFRSAVKRTTPYGERWRVENGWYEADIATDHLSGTLLSLHEKGRGIDHFELPDGKIAGYATYSVTDNLKIGWLVHEKIRDCAAESVGVRTDSQATTVTLDGQIDESQGLRTSVQYTLFDVWPLIAIRREYRYGKPKEDKTEPKEPIEHVRTVAVSFRVACPLETGSPTGSRVLTADGDRVAAFRSTIPNEWFGGGGWRMKCGWAMMEHPQTHRMLLTLFDKERAPHMGAMFGVDTVALEPHWTQTASKPETTIDLAYAFAAGELASADGASAWVAQRAPGLTGGVRVAIIGRFADNEPRVASVLLDVQRREVRLEAALIAGVGEIRTAIAEFPAGSLTGNLAVTVDRARLC